MPRRLLYLPRWRLPRTAGFCRGPSGSRGARLVRDGQSRLAVGVVDRAGAARPARAGMLGTGRMDRATPKPWPQSFGAGPAPAAWAVAQAAAFGVARRAVVQPRGVALRYRACRRVRRNVQRLGKRGFGSKR